MVYVLFFASGVSGLVYQVVWVRAFGNIFGNTIYSASLVVAVFMLGLGAGSHAAGRWADRTFAAAPGPLVRTFGLFELGIGALALGVSALLPHLSALSAAMSTYTIGPDGWNVLSPWSHLARGVLAAALLTPITLLMGGTLTLLVRYVVGGELHAGGWRIAILYGANTAGAALGCLLTDFLLVPRLGLAATQGVACALNVTAAAGALHLARRRAAIAPRGPAPALNAAGTRPPRARAARSAGAPRREKRRVGPAHAALPASVQAETSGAGGAHDPLAWTAAALALAGFAAMGMEIVWFRHVSILLGEYRAVFSLLLAGILCGIGAGSFAGGWLQQRLRQPGATWMALQAVFVVSTFAGLMAVEAREVQQTAAEVFESAAWARAWTEAWFNARPILVVVALPSLAMGVAFPLANALVQRVESQVGRRAGLLYLANTAGAVAGSLVAGFLLLPHLGVQHSAGVLMAIAAAAIGPLFMAARGAPAARAPRIAFGSFGTATAALVAWALLPGGYLISRALLFPLDRAHAVSEGLTEVIAITDGPDGGRVLVTNGHPMSSTELFSQRYMRAMAHIPLLSMDAPARVLVLCYGVGNTAHAAALHPSVRRVDVVDLSANVLRHSRYFADVNHDVLRDPRVHVYVNDGRHHLQMAPPASYDLITLEPPPIVHAGVASLYSREFYAAARSRLRLGGHLSQWLPVFGVPDAVILAMVRAFVDVFPEAVLLSGAGTNLLLVGRSGGAIAIDPERLADALTNAPAVRADLQRLDLGTPREIAGTFVADAATLAEATAGTDAMIDDRPIQEYGKRSLLEFGEGGIPPSLVAVENVGAWCPGCYRAGQPSPLVAGLDTYLSLTGLAYRTPTPGGHAMASGARGRTVSGSGYLGAILPDSPALTRLLRTAAASTEDTADVAARYTRGTELLQAGRFADAAEEFRAVLAASPDAVQARNNLGVALASLGRLDEAIAAFEAALALQPDFTDAQRNLDFARELRRRRSGPT